MATQAGQLDLYPETLFGVAVEAEGETTVLDRCWWVIYTRSRQEKALARDLAGRQIAFYLPLIEKTSYYGSRAVRSRVPLFTNYLFLYGSEHDRLASLTTNRISRIIRVPDPESLRRDLIQVRRLIRSGAPLTVESRWTPGQRVRIKRGPLAGLEGTILQRRGQTRLLVSVDFLKQGASVAVDDFLLEPIEHEAFKRPGTIEY